MKNFSQYCEENKKLIEFVESLNEIDIYQLDEQENYQRIPKTNSSCRFDVGDINKCTVDHAHIFSQQGGKGKELYSVNIDGSGHDGSRGMKISNKHANFLTNNGYTIPNNHVLESYLYEDLILESVANSQEIEFVILFD